MEKIKIATVFSGIGAFEFALKRLSIPYEIVFACDNGEREVDYDYDACWKTIKEMKSIDQKQKFVDQLYNEKTSKKNYVQMTYLENYELKKNRFFQDIKLLDGTDFKHQVDIFVGGSPCQSFSSVGFQKGLEDTRGTLFYDFARLVSEIKPKVFIYENVRNLINHDNGKTWDIILKTFKSLGYNIKYDVLNACDYGIPQNRRRLFVVGFLDGFNINLPKKIGCNYVMHDFLINNCSVGNFNYGKTGELVIKQVPGYVEQEYFLSKLLYKYVMSGGTKTFYSKPVINKPIARTILKTMGNRHRAGIDNYVSEDMSTSYGKVRMLTEREALRLMGFTDDFKMPVSRAQAYKQAGNSIVVDVLMEIILEIFKGENYECFQKN